MQITHTLQPDQLLITYTVDPDQNGKRLDAFLMEHYRNRSREQLKKAIMDGKITVKRSQIYLTTGKIKPSFKLLTGDEVLLTVKRKAEPEVCLNYQIIHEDENILVINKPPLLPVHPAGRYLFNTLLTHLKLTKKSDEDFYLVHRIDKETSGILLLAKKKAICAGLTRQFAQRVARKRYLAIVHGCPEQSRFTVDLPLERKPQSDLGMKMYPDPDSDQNALTEFQVLMTGKQFSLLECFPKTGRQHQIRAHLASIHLPILGDKLYGLEEKEALQIFRKKPIPDTESPHQKIPPEIEAKLILPRHALHAAGLRLRHPIDQRELTFNAELPQDLEVFLEKHLGPLPSTCYRVDW